MICPYIEILPRLNERGIYPDIIRKIYKKESLVEGLSLFCSPMMIRDKIMELKFILGVGWRVDSFPNRQEIQITKKKYQC